LVHFFSLYLFRAYVGGTTICILPLLLISLFRWLSVVLVVFPFNQDNRNSSKNNNSTNCCIHIVYLLMMGLHTPETCRVWRNVLRISCESSWFFFRRLYPAARSTKQKKTRPLLLHFPWQRLFSLLIVCTTLKGIFEWKLL